MSKKISKKRGSIKDHIERYAQKKNSTDRIEALWREKFHFEHMGSMGPFEKKISLMGHLKNPSNLG